MRQNVDLGEQTMVASIHDLDELKELEKDKKLQSEKQATKGKS